MTSSDPIADMLTRLRNAIAVRKQSVTLPHSNLKESVANILKQSNFIDGVTVQTAATGFKELVLTINQEGSNARITEIHRMSTPGRRLYSSAAEIPVVKRGRGIVIISTSKGMMIGKDAKAKQLGGELICKVY
jgi:small subunit ribosomal protein S8